MKRFQILSHDSLMKNEKYQIKFLIKARVGLQAFSQNKIPLIIVNEKFKLF
jgi:hypothetical protein